MRHKAHHNHHLHRSESRDSGLHRLNLISNPVQQEHDASAPDPSSADRSPPNGGTSISKEEPILEVQHSHESRANHTIFKQRKEANSVELFYDLFFVANLTVFGLDHEIIDGQTLSSYVGFFTILWFTWLQVTLFDARFSFDSFFDRLCKALQFGVMVGFAIVGPSFNTNGENPGTMQALSLILMSNRILLMVQYGMVLLFARKNKEAIAPLVLKMLTLGLAAAAFLGISFSFIKETNSRGQIGWYVVSLVEAAFLLAISSRWTGLSFRHTCLPERVGLLTLIILGEGIIGFSKNISTITGSFYSVSTLVGMAICSVLITYLLFLLYFDQVDPDRFGTVRQSIWTIAHFPLNLAFLLTLEGVNQLSLFTIAYQQVLNVDQTFNTATGNSTSPKDIVNILNETFVQLSSDLPNAAPIPQSFNDTLTDILANNITESNVNDLFSEISAYVFSSYGYGAHSFNVEDLDEVSNTVSTAYLYLFISAGAALLSLAGLLWLGKRNLSRAEYCVIGNRIAIGVGLALISLMSLDSQSNNYSNYVPSGWPLPTVMLSLLLVLGIDRLILAIFS